MNATLEAHRQGAIDDQSLENGIRTFFVNPAYRPDDRIDAIKALHQSGVQVVAYDAREMLTPNEPTDYQALRDTGWGSGQAIAIGTAHRLGQQFPDSTRFDAFIRAAQKEGVPADTISAVIISETLGKDGNAIVLPGADHANGNCSIEYQNQGILDEALKAQGIIVTDAQIFANIAEAKDFDDTMKTLREASPPDDFCEITGDALEYAVLLEENSLYTPENISSLGIEDPYPIEEFPDAKSVYEAHELDPRTVASLAELVPEAKKGWLDHVWSVLGYETNGHTPADAAYEGHELDPQTMASLAKTLVDVDEGKSPLDAMTAEERATFEELKAGMMQRAGSVSAADREKDRGMDR